MKHLPAGSLVVVVDDGSKPASVVPDVVKLLRHETSLGIVASKNASLSALMDAGCEHLFLWAFGGRVIYPCYSLVDHADLQTVERHPDNEPRTERRRAWRLA